MLFARVEDNHCELMKGTPIPHPDSGEPLPPLDTKSWSGTSVGAALDAALPELDTREQIAIHFIK